VCTDFFAATGPLTDGVTPAVPTPRQPAGPGARRPDPARGDRATVPDLSPREREVLHQLAARRSTTRLAEDLAVSPNTVRSHVRTLQRKLAAPDRAGIVHRARRLGLL
jgi:LuxR family transcriptional regulator, maltose regulon positive regulatory protein